jgi:hypothetical protein
VKPEDRPPSSDELLAMAYADGELDAEQCAAFELRLRREPALAGEVAVQRRLAVVARDFAPPEPMDYEWERIARSRATRVGLWLAWVMIAIGGIGSILFGEFELLESNAHLLFKILVTLLVTGVILLFSLTMRARLRTRKFDPYTEVKR